MDIVFLAGIVITVATAIPVFLQLLRGHPRGLFVLFFAEMWERFSYYGMRGLLIFFMTQHMLFDDAFAAGRYGAYTSLVYLMPLIGGFLADRFIGTRKAILFGAILLVAGHFTMGVEGPPAQQILKYADREYAFDVAGRMDEREVRIVVDGVKYEFGASSSGGFEIRGLPEGAPLPAVLEKGTYELSVVKPDKFYTDIFYLALALIIMGVGFLKANISSIVGQLYEQGDPRRDPGFTLYYYGINLGAFWAAIACGWLGTYVGWWAGFGAAGVGMLLGFIVFGLGKPLLEGKGEPPDPEALKRSALGPINVEWFIYLCGILGVGVVWLIVQRHELAVNVVGSIVFGLTQLGLPPEWLGDGQEPVGFLLAAGSVIVLAYIFVFMFVKCTFIEAQRIILALILIATSVVFWTLFEQAGSSLNQFADRNTDLAIGGGASITAAQTQSFNAGFILLLAPAFSALWAFLARLNLDPNPPLKFGLALLQVGAGFFVLVWGAQFADEGFRVPLIFLVLAYLLHTTGELCISPVGLSQMTRLAPAAVVSTIMATWFLASSWAQFVGGIVAKMTASETVAGQVLDPQKALETYLSVFEMIGWWGLVLGGIMVVLSPILGYLAHAKAAAKPQPAE
jgi:POT family proton-dependent oligopeptide transporter